MQYCIQNFLKSHSLLSTFTTTMLAIVFIMLMLNVFVYVYTIPVKIFCGRSFHGYPWTMKIKPSKLLLEEQKNSTCSAKCRWIVALLYYQNQSEVCWTPKSDCCLQRIWNFPCWLLSDQHSGRQPLHICRECFIAASNQWRFLQALLPVCGSQAHNGSFCTPRPHVLWFLRCQIFVGSLTNKK